MTLIFPKQALVTNNNYFKNLLFIAIITNCTITFVIVLNYFNQYIIYLQRGAFLWLKNLRTLNPKMVYL